MPDEICQSPDHVLEDFQLVAGLGIMKGWIGDSGFVIWRKAQDSDLSVVWIITLPCFTAC